MVKQFNQLRNHIGNSERQIKIKKSCKKAILMFPNQDVLFQTATHPHLFSAMGYLLGSFQPTPEQEIKHFIPGKFLTSEGLELIASIRKRDWEKLRGWDDFEEEGKFYWRSYFRTTKWGNLSKINLIKPLINPPLLVSPDGETLEEITDLFQVRGVLSRIFQKALKVRVERNDLPPEGFFCPTPRKGGIRG